MPQRNMAMASSARNAIRVDCQKTRLSGVAAISSKVVASAVAAASRVGYSCDTRPSDFGVTQSETCERGGNPKAGMKAAASATAAP